MAASEFAEQLVKTGGQSIRAYCGERGLKESAFYGWRGRLRKHNTPSQLRFALVESKPSMENGSTHRTAAGQRRPASDSVRCATTLKLVLAVLREPA